MEVFAGCVHRASLRYEHATGDGDMMLGKEIILGAAFTKRYMSPVNAFILPQ